MTSTGLSGLPESGATFSPCRAYRYSLWRKWGSEQGGYAMFVGLNPSTADETLNDRTVRRCIAFAKAWGYSGMFMTNIFAYRATDPKVMKAVAEPVGRENDDALHRLAQNARVVVAAWGVHGVHAGREEAVRALLSGIHCLKLTKHGAPGHALYFKKTLVPIPFN